MTSTEPSNRSELQLYRVLQRANLLQYYDTFIQQGGDDVQQLCEAGEEEFLEIMALVGMAKKPLHVRRLQKALQEWVSSQSNTRSVAFQPHLDQDNHSQGAVDVAGMNPVTSAAAIVAAVQQAAALAYTAQPSTIPSIPVLTVPTMVASQSTKIIDIKPEIRGSPSGENTMSGWARNLSPSPGSPDSQGCTGMGDRTGQYDQDASRSPGQNDGKRASSPTPSTGSGSGSNGYEARLSTSPIPCSGLSEHQVQAIAASAEKLAHSLPPLPPKPMNMRKNIAKMIEEAMNLPFDEPGRLDLMRKYGAIYGRFDSKRKNEKPMSLHEVSVNEAAAHLCFHIPSLLTRREELFPMARQVVRQSGYQYAKGHSRAQASMAEGCSPVKRPRLDFLMKTELTPQDVTKREDRLVEITRQLSQIASEQEALRTQLASARDAEEYDRLHTLQSELEELMTWNAQLTAEHGHLTRLTSRPFSIRNIVSVQKRQSRSCSPSVGDMESPATINVNGVSHSADGHLQFMGSEGRSGSHTGQFVHETLYDEGLRIAQQYGMADFAAELKELKPEGQNGQTEGEFNEEKEEKDEEQPLSLAMKPEKKSNEGEESSRPNSEQDSNKDAPVTSTVKLKEDSS